MTEQVIEQLTGLQTVPVEVKNHPRKKVLRSSLKSYSIDPVNVPVVQIAPYNPSRVKAHITTNDTACVISLDNQNVAMTSVAGTAPFGNSIQLGTMGNGFDGYIIYGPDPIWAVAIVGNTVTRVNIVQTFETDA